MADRVIVARLRQLLRYDPDSGSWTWLEPTSNRVKTGGIAGRRGGNGYWGIKIDGRRYPTSVLAFLYMTGEWPSGVIDHIDRNPENNRWSNLRCVSHAQNCANRGRNKNNTSGFKGVTWDKRQRRWVAQIQAHGKHHGLGYFRDPQAAHAAYLAAAQKYFGEFAGV
jgi:hypothetical protein